MIASPGSASLPGGGSESSCGRPRGRNPSVSRSALRCMVVISAFGRLAAQTTKPGVSSSSRPCARVPPAPQPIRLRGPSRSCTSESNHFAIGRCGPDAKTRQRSQSPARLSRARSAASAAALTVSNSSERPTETAVVALGAPIALAAGPAATPGGRGGTIQVFADEAVEVAVQHTLRVADLEVRPVVLHPLVGVEEVAADLGSPLGRLLLPTLLPQLLGAVELHALEQAGTQKLHRGRLVLRLRALVLALDDDPAGDVGDPHSGVGLVDVLAARAGGAVRVDPDVAVVDLHLDVALHQGRDVDLREAGVAASG